MTAERWTLVQDLFHRALERAPAERAAFLSTATDDPTLVDDVRALLDADADGLTILEGGVERAAAVLDARPPGPEAVGPYRIAGVLGEGGVGTVYLAERDDLGSRAAVKVLRDAALSPARVARFRQEERILAGLDHPAIARLLDADRLPDGTPYFVMEYVEGVPITDYAEAHGLSVGARLALFREVCEAVAAAHRQAVVHRDLKPSNVFVAEGDDGRPHVKLLDFGIAKPLDDGGAPADQTVTGLRLMTPAYAAPEQLRGEPVGVYTDVYALGALLYELLTDRRPFDDAGLAPAEAEARVLNDDPAPPSVVARTAGGARRPSRRAWADLDVLCRTALRKDPDRRYATVEALVRDLDHFRDGEPLDARPDSVGYRAGKFVRRHRVPAAAVAAVAVLVVGLVAFYTVRLAAARDAALAEAATAETVSDYLVGLFDASDPFRVGADTTTVAGLLARGAERAEELDGQPEAQAQMLDALGRVHRQRGEYGQAEPLLRRALDLRERHGGPLDRAETLMNLGVLHAERGDLEAAETDIRASLVLLETHLAPDHPDFAAGLAEYGGLLVNTARYAEADSVFRRALVIQRRTYSEPHKLLSHTLSNLGVSLFNQGRAEEAEPYYREALEIARAVYGPDHPRTAVEIGNLAMVYQARGDLATADSMLTDALRIRRAALGEDHFVTGLGYGQLGSVAFARGDLDRAQRLVREAIRAYEGTLGPDHPHTTSTRALLAGVLRDQGQTQEAEVIYRRTARVLSDALGPDNGQAASSRCHLAYVVHLNGGAAEAGALYRECLPVVRDAYPEGHRWREIHESRFREVAGVREG